MSKPVEPLAIVGIGCRLPGNVSSGEEFWSLLQNGVDAITEVPDNRWNLDAFYDQSPQTSGAMYTRWGGFLNDISSFDAEFFRIPPREVASMDPQQRWILETAFEALEDSGTPLEKIKKKSIGVFIGVTSNDYSDIQKRGTHAADFYTNSGGAVSIVANRVSYSFDLRGPSMVIDTACSSSLVAVHVACQSIWSGECESALVGGVNALLTPDLTIGFCKASMLSPDGKCYAFDSRANGYVRAEGAGVIFVKPLSQAIRDSNRIYALIRSTVANQDGRTSSLPVPSVDAQAEMLRKACEIAQISPSKLCYVEAHGTGTAIGDPIEARAIGKACSVDRSLDSLCAIGSVKTNIGHLESASGIAGLIKVALMLHHRTIVPQLHFQSPNPEIDFHALKLRVPLKRETFDVSEGELYAGVNSFGFGGSNAHTLLSDYVTSEDSSVPEIQLLRERLLLPISARSQNALKENVANVRRLFEATNEHSARELCHALSVRKTHFPVREIVDGNGKSDFIQKLSELENRLEQEASSNSVLKSHNEMAFIFTGQGQQWFGMGAALLREEKVFRDHLMECDDLFQEFTEWSLIDALSNRDAELDLSQTYIAQPVLFALQTGLATLWRSWGIEPEVVAGHSLGEVSAAYVAEMYSLRDALKLVYHRSRLQQRAHGSGAMAVVGCDPDRADEIISESDGRIELAAINSPQLVTLSGDVSIIETLIRKLSAESLFCRSLGVDYAFHSQQMDELKDELLLSLQDLNSQPGKLSMISTVTGEEVAHDDLSNEYWWRNVREPVFFAKAVQELLERGFTTFLEIGPHPALKRSIRESASHASSSGEVTVLPSLIREASDYKTLFASLRRLYIGGHRVNWNAFYSGNSQHIELPKYSWQKQQYWNEPIEARSHRLLRPGYRMLDERVRGPVPMWKCNLDIETFPYLNDHRIQGSLICPAATFTEFALSASSECFDDEVFELTDIEFVSTLPISIDRHYPLYYVYDQERRSFRVCSGDEQDKPRWNCHMQGTIEITNESSSALVKTIRGAEERCIEKEELYQGFEQVGYSFGPLLRTIQRLWVGEDSVTAEISLPEQVFDDIGRYCLSTPLIDAGFQSLVGFTGRGVQADEFYVPRSISKLRWVGRPERKSFCTAYLKHSTPHSATVDLIYYTVSGKAIAEISGFTIQRVSQEYASQKNSRVCYRYLWSKEEEVSTEPVSIEDSLDHQMSTPGVWLLFVDSFGVCDDLVSMLKTHGDTCIMIHSGLGSYHSTNERISMSPHEKQHFTTLFDQIANLEQPLKGIIYAWGLQQSEGRSEFEEMDTGIDCVTEVALGLFHLVQVLADGRQSMLSRVWVLTKQPHSSKGANVPAELSGAGLWGFARAVHNEHPELPVTIVQVDQENPLSSVLPLYNELWAEKQEPELSFDQGERFVRRLEKSSEPSLPQKSIVVDCHEKNASGFELQFELNSKLDNLTLKETSIPKPLPHEVQVRVSATALNFRDVLKSLGLYPRDQKDSYTLGDECVGSVVACGEGVKDFAVGDEVLAIHPGCFRSHVNVDGSQVVRKPAFLTNEEAVTLPVAFLTAYYALVEVARIRRNDLVLIHAGAGGVGQAAIQVANAYGARVFATAGSDEKRAFLSEQGVEQVMDSRTLEFADEVMAYTQGDGVDIVLNCLSGEYLRKSLGLLSRHGCFIELGKRDIVENRPLDLRQLADNRSFATVDLSSVFGVSECKKTDGKRLLKEIISRIEQKIFTALPKTIFPISEASKAFKHMSQAKHIGKIVVSYEEEKLNVQLNSSPDKLFRKDSAYLVVGGTSGFGFESALWIAEKGAGKVFLMSRSGLSDEKQHEVEARFTELECAVEIVRADVSKFSEVEQVIHHIARDGLPLRGVFHAAMVLENGIIDQLDAEKFEKVMLPKVQGAWNLHLLTQDVNLDYFVLYSSVLALLGSVGQANYAAANSFLDGLAQYRRDCGLPALSVNWGMIADSGYLARHTDVADQLLRFTGITPMSSEYLLERLSALLSKDLSQVGVFDLDWDVFFRQFPAASKTPSLSKFSAASKNDSFKEQDGRRVREKILKLPKEGALEVLRDYLNFQIARALGANAESISNDLVFTEAGLDSLTMFQLKMQFDNDLNISLQASDFTESTASIDTLADVLLELVRESSSNSSEFSKAV